MTRYKLANMVKKKLKLEESTEFYLKILDIDFIECTRDELIFLLEEHYIHKKPIIKYIKDTQKNFSFKQYEKFLKFKKENPKDNNSKLALISKYGEEEGLRFFNEIKSKTVNTLENFIKRYGDKGYELYYEKNKNHSNKMKAYISEGKINMDKNSLKSFIEKYGEEEGTKRYKENCIKMGYTNSLKSFIEKYGEEEGTKRYKERNKKTAHTLENYKKWYKDDWKEKWENRKKSLETSLESFIERYGEVQGKIKFESYITKMRKTLEDSGVWVKEEDIGLFEKYSRKVWAHTNKITINEAKNYQNRGTQKTKDKPYHLDHIISIKTGFEFDIDPEFIGSISNIQFIEESENTSKRYNSYSVISQCEHIKESFYKN